jgi:NAD(P)-dependent dehydrogenase (short-subunit alcohol dehydrogenase family)
MSTKKVALVTGGSRGLGEVIAAVLAAQGYNLVVGGRDLEALDRVRQRLSAAGAGVTTVAADIAEPSTRTAYIEAARELGGLDVLVNNASELGPIGPLLDFDVPRLGRLFPVNAAAPLWLTQLAAPLLAERRGLIVNITSDAAVAGYPGWGPYGASKAALELISRTLASELAGRGIAVVLVDPTRPPSADRSRDFPRASVAHRQCGAERPARTAGDAPDDPRGGDPRRRRGPWVVDARSTPRSRLRRGAAARLSMA